MKVLHINISDQGGGAEQFAFEITHSKLFDSKLLVKDKKTDSKQVDIIKQSLLGQGLDIIDRLLYKLFDRKQFSSSSALFNVNKTYDFLNKHPWYVEADVICLHNIHDVFFDLNTLKKIAKEKKLVWILHDQWCMTGGEAYVFQDTSYQQGKAQTPYDSYYPLYKPFIDWRSQCLEKKKEIYNILGDKLTFIPVSIWLAEGLKKAYVYAKNNRIHTIQNGVDIECFHINTRRDWEVPRVLFFNSKNPFKGSETFIQILSKITTKFELHVVGEKPLNSPTNTITYDRINNREKLNELYNQVDIMVFPSSAENFPLTVLEAMSAGVCVLAAATGGIVEQIDDNTGFLFPTGDEQALLQLMQKVLSTDIHLIRRIGEEASQKVHEKYSKEEMMQKYKTLFTSLVN